MHGNVWDVRVQANVQEEKNPTDLEMKLTPHSVDQSQSGGLRTKYVLVKRSFEKLQHISAYSWNRHVYSALKKTFITLLFKVNQLFLLKHTASLAIVRKLPPTLNSNCKSVAYKICLFICISQIYLIHITYFFHAYTIPGSWHPAWDTFLRSRFPRLVPNCSDDGRSEVMGCQDDCRAGTCCRGLE